MKKKKDFKHKRYKDFLFEDREVSEKDKPYKREKLNFTDLLENDEEEYENIN